MRFAAYPLPPHDPALDLVAAVLDPVLTPLGFAPGSAAASEGHGQVINCRGVEGSVDLGCLDLVVDLEPLPDWRITDVRYWATGRSDGTCRSFPTRTSRRNWRTSLEHSPTIWPKATSPAFGDAASGESHWCKQPRRRR